MRGRARYKTAARLAAVRAGVGDALVASHLDRTTMCGKPMWATARRAGALASPLQPSRFGTPLPRRHAAQSSRNRAPSRRPSSKVLTTLSGEEKSQADTGTSSDGQA